MVVGEDEIALDDRRGAGGEERLAVLLDLQIEPPDGSREPPHRFVVAQKPDRLEDVLPVDDVAGGVAERLAKRQDHLAVVFRRQLEVDRQSAWGEGGGAEHRSGEGNREASLQSAAGPAVLFDGTCHCRAPQLPGLLLLISLSAKVSTFGSAASS